MRRSLFLGGVGYGGFEGGVHFRYIPGRVDRARDMSLIHESHVSGTEKVAS